MSIVKLKKILATSFYTVLNRKSFKRSQQKGKRARKTASRWIIQKPGRKKMPRPWNSGCGVYPTTPVACCAVNSGINISAVALRKMRPRRGKQD